MSTKNSHNDYLARQARDLAKAVYEDPGYRYYLLDHAHEDEDCWAACVTMSRLDSAFFCEFVLEDESRPGHYIRNARMHNEWHYLTDQHRFVIFVTHFEAGKSMQLSVGRKLWRLGRDTTRRILIVQSNAKIAAKTVGVMADYIQSSERLHAVFPNLIKGSPWRPKTKEGGDICVQRDSKARDPSVQGIGYFGNVLGARLTDVVGDDWLTFKNTMTEGEREKGRKWFENSVLSRPVAGAEIILVGNRWHRKDGHEEFKRRKRWFYKLYPIRGADGMIQWDSRWTEERVTEHRDTISESEYRRTMECELPLEGSQRFNADWFAAAKVRGARVYPVFSANELELDHGDRVAVGVDIATGKRVRNSRRHFSSFFALLRKADGTRRPLWLETGDYQAPAILSRIREYKRRYGVVFVENNQAQDFIVQFSHLLLSDESDLRLGDLTPDQLAVMDKTTQELLRVYGTALPVVPFITGAKRKHPTFGVEGLGIPVSQGKVIWPAAPIADGHPMEKAIEGCYKELDSLIMDALDYDPLFHPSDRLMAWWIADAGIESRVGFQYRVGGVGPETYKPKDGDIIKDPPPITQEEMERESLRQLWSGLSDGLGVDFNY